VWRRWRKRNVEEGEEESHQRTESDESYDDEIEEEKKWGRRKRE
jgi:hypothetical protein